ncbi:cbb3-type cytochrome oxidase assembly protein CcoS [Luteimonas sp. FCS-9]|uniref:cbb3-type cytochrome oxidase assembly protein CcoS n=1 Tax=Luteimonas sp. FCS-9 TaxID=1547516 RepID=UPI00063EAD62|nr:cbb3-type cytochrome oxidase assembly protein CcoS [Luteimonas sp. FCS-9]KLJ01964.1 cytochrome oxidase maturation protein Cbb3 [Luteimonas sp. FCS-9]
MRILLLLIPISLVLLGIAIAAFVWAVKRGQFDDLDTPALDILVDDDGRDDAGRAPAIRPPQAPAAQDRPRAD